MRPKRRPKPWAETGRQGRTRYVWRFEGQKYRTAFHDDPEEARADATAQITQQMQGTWRDRSGARMLLEDWIDVWSGMLHDIEPTTIAYYRYLVEFHILAEFQGRELGSLTFEEIEAWDTVHPQAHQLPGPPLRAVRRLLGPLSVHHDPQRRRPRRQDRPQPRRTPQGPPRPQARQGPGTRPRTPARHRQRDHPTPGPLPG